MDAQRLGRACPRGRPRGHRDSPSSQRRLAGCLLCAPLRCNTSRGDRWLCRGTQGRCDGDAGSRPCGGFTEPGGCPHPYPHNPPPKPVPPKAPAPRLGVPRKPGSPCPRAFSRSSLQEKGPSQSTCHALGPLTPHALPWGGGGDGERQRAAGAAAHLSSSIFFFLMSSMRSRRFWASSLRRRPSSKVAMRSCTCFCWFSRTWRLSSLACHKRPVAFFSSSSLSLSICSL